MVKNCENVMSGHGITCKWAYVCGWGGKGGGERAYL